MERVMKGLQWLATMALVVAGVLLLVKPLTAHAQTAAFVPTRFTVVDEGTVGKPDVVLIPGLSSSRAVWEGEAKPLAPNYRLQVEGSRQFIMDDQPGKFEAAAKGFLQ